MFRKIFAVLSILAFVGTLALTACGSDDDGNKAGNGGAGNGGAGNGGAGNGGAGNSGGNTIACTDGSNVSLDSMPNCASYLTKLQECCPNSAAAITAAMQSVVCVPNSAQVDAACKIAVDNATAWNAVCTAISAQPGCK